MKRCVADGYLRLRLGLDRSARVPAGTIGCLRFSRKPSRKLLIVPGGHTVLSEPVMYARMDRKDGDTPPGLQGLGPSATRRVLSITTERAARAQAGPDRWAGRK